MTPSAAVLADQWKDIVTAAPFDEHTVVAPGIRKDSQNGRGANYGSEDILSNGSVIFVPENTAAFVFSQAGIEQVITQPVDLSIATARRPSLTRRTVERRALATSSLAKLQTALGSRECRRKRSASPLSTCAKSGGSSSGARTARVQRPLLRSRPRDLLFRKLFRPGDRCRALRTKLRPCKRDVLLTR